MAPPLVHLCPQDALQAPTWIWGFTLPQSCGFRPLKASPAQSCSLVCPSPRGDTELGSNARLKLAFPLFWKLYPQKISPAQVPLWPGVGKGGKFRQEQWQTGISFTCFMRKLQCPGTLMSLPCPTAPGNSQTCSLLFLTPCLLAGAENSFPSLLGVTPCCPARDFCRAQKDLETPKCVLVGSQSLRRQGCQRAGAGAGGQRDEEEDMNSSETFS